MRFDNYLVIDLEATCCDQGTIPLGETEIIEIGAVMADARSLQPVDEFDAFVRPVRHPVLTDFCTRLTSITQSEVDAAQGFPDVLARLIQWASVHSSCVFSSWGEYDRKQLARDCSFHRISYPFPEHVNLKRLFATKMGLRKPDGLAPALRRVGLPVLTARGCCAQKGAAPISFSVGQLCRIC